MLFPLQYPVSAHILVPSFKRHNFFYQFNLRLQLIRIISVLTYIICNNNSQFMIYRYLSIICQFKCSFFVYHKPRFLIRQAHIINAVFFKFIKCFPNRIFDLFFSITSSSSLICFIYFTTTAFTLCFSLSFN